MKATVEPLLVNGASGNDSGADGAVQPVCLVASDVSHSVQVRKGLCRKVTKHILHSVSVSFEPGTLTGLMGLSGAGKTTLLSLLRSGRCTQGSITMNGSPFRSSASRAVIRTIPQDDILLAGLTAREALTYAASLSLPRGLTRAQREQRVSTVLTQLHLSAADAETKIGSVDSRGLSGGQRKRVSIGLELLANPSVLLVDEPTSGLDAKMAYDVVAILGRLAAAGRTVVTTIHQPSFALFSTFDALLVLDGGRVAYAGPQAAAAAHFGRLSFVTPPHENPGEPRVPCARHVTTCAVVRCAQWKPDVWAWARRVTDARPPRERS